VITVMGATGHTGRKIAERLLAAGASVRVLGRSAEKLRRFAECGVESLSGDAADRAFLTEAFRGSDAVYTLLPTDRAAPDYRAEQDRQGEAIAMAVRESGVSHVVALSSLGADVGSNMGIIDGLHAQELRLRTLAHASVLLLRPVSFFENFLEALPLLRSEGIICDSVGPDVAVQFVATEDIADVAAAALLHRGWQGTTVRELLGPRDLTYAEATRIIGASLGLAGVRYVQLPYSEMAAALVRVGMSESFASQYVQMTRAFNEGRVVSPGGRRAENTTPTRLEDFVATLARAYRSLEFA